MERLDAFAQDTEMQQKWKRFAGTINIPLDFEEVIGVIGQFVGPIYKAIIAEDELLGIWNPREMKYEGYAQTEKP